MDRDHKLRLARQVRLNRRLDVLTHYSPHKKLGCAWAGCPIKDPQMLTLDHTNADGAEHRRRIGRSSNSLYAWVIRNKFPRGFRTLCGGHNLKAEIQRRVRTRKKLGDEDSD